MLYGLNLFYQEDKQLVWQVYKYNQLTYPHALTIYISRVLIKIIGGRIYEGIKVN